MIEMSASLYHLAWIVPVLLLAVYLFSPRGKGQIIESRALRLVSLSLQHSRFIAFADYPLSTPAGPRQIPLLIVSEFGLFVGRTTRRKGRITGTAVQDRWTQSSLGRKQSFDNPLYKAELDIQALQRQLDLAGLWFHPFVVFPDNHRFTGERPKGVVSAPQLTAFIRKHDDKLIEQALCQAVVSRLEELRSDQPGNTGQRYRALIAWALIASAVTGIWFCYQTPISNAWAVLNSSWSAQSSIENDGMAELESVTCPAFALHRPGSPRSEPGRTFL